MSSMPFSVRVAMRMDVPRNPVCKQKIVLCEVFAQAVYHLRFGFAFHKLVLQGEQGRSLHSVEDGGFEGAVLVEEVLFDVCLCRISHLLVLAGIATGGGGHVPHHESIYHPVGSTQIVPVADGIRKRTLGRKSQSAAAFQRFIAQPVGPLVVAVLTAEVSWLYLVSLIWFINKFMAFQFSSMICVSPNCFHTVQVR